MENAGKAQITPGSCLVLLKDITLNSDTTISEGNFALSLGRWHLRCADSQNEIALVISGGEISIKDGTFDRLKVTGDGKLTLNGGKYYAIDVTGSTYANYGQLLPGGYAFKTSSGWEAKGDITAERFASDTAKEVKILPLRSVEISPAASAVAFGTSVTFTATPSHTDGATYQWYRNGVAIQGRHNEHTGCERICRRLHIPLRRHS